ncbi:hypothetical protein QTN25_000308 [Entamoeba marina]
MEQFKNQVNDSTNLIELKNNVMATKELLTQTTAQLKSETESLKELNERVSNNQFNLIKVLKETTMVVPTNKRHLIREIESWDNIDPIATIISKNTEDVRAATTECKREYVNTTKELEDCRQDIETLKVNLKATETDIREHERECVLLENKQTQIIEEQKRLEYKKESIDKTELENILTYGSNLKKNWMILEFELILYMRSLLLIQYTSLNTYYFSRKILELRLNYIKDKTLEKNNHLMMLYKNFYEKSAASISLLRSKVSDSSKELDDVMVSLGVDLTTFLPSGN